MITIYINFLIYYDSLSLAFNLQSPVFVSKQRPVTSNVRQCKSQVQSRRRTISVLRPYVFKKLPKMIYFFTRKWRTFQFIISFFNFFLWKSTTSDQFIPGTRTEFIQKVDRKRNSAYECFHLKE